MTINSLLIKVLQEISSKASTPILSLVPNRYDPEHRGLTFRLEGENSIRTGLCKALTVKAKGLLLKFWLTVGDGEFFVVVEEGTSVKRVRDLRLSSIASMVQGSSATFPIVINLLPSKLNMSASQDEIPPPPPPLPSSSQTPTQQTPHIVSTIKLPILKKGEYDIWAMKMEHYLAHTDYPIWEPEKERKARTTLLMALPEDHLAKFHKMNDAKEMWDAIKSRFSRNEKSKKMQKYILKQQFEGFSVSNTEGLHKGYNRFQSLLSQLEIHGAGVSTEDANQKFLRSLPSA
ncbi:hypothetical protein Tco_1056698 [Tanacetum coccineum]|uniref:Uncharacterized protein n=1 Tax=Tanacetum coccineum TaxID=301880 RepID=A0ABQ5H3C9_9ASTR